MAAGRTAWPLLLTLLAMMVTPVAAQTSSMTGALGQERSYDVEAASQLPTVGAVGLSMRVQLVEVERPHVLPGASRMFRLAIEPGSRITNKHGVSEDPGNLHTHPVFFSQRDDGAIVDFHHHGRETDDAVAHKKMLAGYLQFPLAAPSSPRQWQQLEVDANGAATANYSSRGGLFRRRLVTKDVAWEPSRGRPKELGFHMKSKARAIPAQPPAT